MMKSIAMLLILALAVGKWVLLVGLISLLVYQIRPVKRWIENNIEFY